MTNNPSPENSFNRSSISEEEKARALEKVTNRLATKKNADFLEQQRIKAASQAEQSVELGFEEPEAVQTRIDMGVEEFSRVLGEQALAEVEEPKVTPKSDDEIIAKSSEPSLLAEEVDLWPQIYSNEDLDEAWAKVIAERGDIAPSLKNLNAMSMKPDSPVPPPGIIQDRLSDEGGLSAFQARHGYTEPSEESPTSRKQPVPDKNEDKVKTAERLEAANLWLTRFKDTELNADTVVPASEEGRFFTLEQIDNMGGLELLGEDIEALRDLTNPRKLAEEVKKIKAARSNKNNLEEVSENIDKIVDSVAIDFGSDVQPVEPIEPIEPEITPEAPDTNL